MVNVKRPFAGQDGQMSKLKSHTLASKPIALDFVFSLYEDKIPIFWEHLMDNGASGVFRIFFLYISFKKKSYLSLIGEG